MYDAYCYDVFYTLSYFGIIVAISNFLSSIITFIIIYKLYLMIQDKGDVIMNYNGYLLIINLLINLSPIIGYPIIKYTFYPLNGMKF